MVARILKLGLLFSPLCYLSGISIGKFDLIFFHLFCASIIGASFFDNRKREIKCDWMAMLVAIGILNAISMQFNVFVLNGLINLILGSIVIKIIAEYVDFEVRFIDFMAMAGLLNVIIMAFQTFGFSPIIDNPAGEPGGIMGNAPRLGNYLTVTLPFMWFYRRDVFFVYLLAGILMGELAIIVIGIILMTLTVSKKIKMYIVTLTMIFLMLFANDFTQSIQARWLIWKPTIEQIFTRPLVGFGMDLFRHTSKELIMPSIPQLPDDVPENAFSSMLQFIFSFGFILSMIWILKFLKDFKDSFVVSPAHMFMICLIILSFFEYPFEIVKLWPTLIAGIGFYLIKINWRKSCLSNT